MARRSQGRDGQHGLARSFTDASGEPDQAAHPLDDPHLCASHSKQHPVRRTVEGPGDRTDPVIVTQRQAEHGTGTGADHRAHSRTRSRALRAAARPEQDATGARPGPDKGAEEMSGLADQDRAHQDQQVWPRPAVSAWQDPASVQRARPAEQARPPALTPSPAKRADPRGHWFLLAIGMLLAAGALVLNGYVTNVVGETRTAPPATDHPSPQLAEMRRGGPVLNLTGSEPSSAHLPNKTIALTFDDGPDPAWTPTVLDALKKHGATATFFVVGSKVAKYPELTRRIVAEGHELGSHTYTHAELATVPGWRLRLELSLTQKALAGATGLHTALVRPPYSSTPEAITGPQWESMKALAAEGYLVTLADLDTKDWSRPGTRKIVTSSLPTGGRGAVVMMHDSGGDRRQTVEAVDLVLKELAGKGYRAVTVTKALGMPSAQQQAGGADRFVGSALNLAQRASGWFTDALLWVLVAAGALTLARLVFFAVLAWVHARRTRGGKRRRGRAPAWPAPPPVTVIVPAYNEAAGIQATVRSLADTAYQGRLEILVIDDGSTDATAELATGLGLPNVRVIRQPNGGKPAALNTGIAEAGHELLIMVDGDTVFEPATIGHLVRQLSDPTVGAVSGNTKVGNRRGMIGRWQHIEYVIGFNLDRRAFEQLDCMATVPGAIGAFRRWWPWAASAPTRWRRTPTSRWHCAGPDGAWSTRRRPWPGPRPRPRSASCGSSATAGATAPCRRCGSIGAPYSTRTRSVAAASATWRCSRCCCRCSHPSSTSWRSTARP